MKTLVTLPTVSISSPYTNGGIYLVTTGQTLTITVDAQAGPGGSIQSVNYYFWHK